MTIRNNASVFSLTAVWSVCPVTSKDDTALISVKMAAKNERVAAHVNIYLPGRSSPDWVMTDGTPHEYWSKFISDAFDEYSVVAPGSETIEDAEKASEDPRRLLRSQTTRIGRLEIDTEDRIENLDREGVAFATVRKIYNELLRARFHTLRAKQFC